MEVGDKHNNQYCDKVVLHMQVFIIQSYRNQLLKMTES